MKAIAFAIACILALPGCLGMTPAVRGKTSYNVEFSDVTSDQATNYKMNIKAPAGVDIASVTGMTYGWKPDGSGDISVSSQGSLDTSGQAAMITEVSRQQVEAFKAGLDAALSSLAPFIGQYFDARVREGEIKAGVAHSAIDAVTGGAR